MQQPSYPPQPTQPPYPPPSDTSNTVRNAIIAVAVVIVVVIIIWVFLTLIYPATLKTRTATLQVEIDCTNLLFTCENVVLSGDVSWSGDVGAWSNMVISSPKEWMGEECKSFTVTVTHGSEGMTKTIMLCDGETKKIYLDA